MSETGLSRPDPFIKGLIMRYEWVRDRSTHWSSPTANTEERYSDR